MRLFKNKAIVLQYQNISEDTENFLDTWIYHKSFEEQLEFFSKNDFPIISLSDVIAYLNGKLHIKKQSFCLTFDTGFVEHFTLGYPLLKKFGYPATFFVRIDTIGKKDCIRGRNVQYMDWDQNREQANAGMTIGLYGCKGQWLTKTPLEDVEKEVADAKEALKKELKMQVAYYGVREGVPSRDKIDFIKKEGFEAVLCQSPTKQRLHPYAVGRVQIDDNDFNIFLIKVSYGYIIFKDSRYWKFIRGYKLDRFVHMISNFTNRLKGKEVY